MNQRRKNPGRQSTLLQKDSKSPALEKTVILPKPGLVRRLSVAAALERRKTTREIGDRELSLQTLSNLLWAACGVNRIKGPFDTPGRTAASASNSQEIDVYILTGEGVFLYDPFQNLLRSVLQVDLRSIAVNPGQASLAVKAPLHLVYVADVDRLVKTSGFQEPGLHDPEVQKAYCFVDTGMIAANVYLFAASAGLAAWFHNCNKPALTKRLNLRPDQHVLFAQTVGYAKKN